MQHAEHQGEPGEPPADGCGPACAEGEPVIKDRGTGAGADYVLDNQRWLHGRRAYTGPRLVYRIVAASARPGLVVGGFPAPLDRVAAS